MSETTPSEARARVEATLAASAREDGVERVVVGEAIEAGRYRVYFYQAREYIEGDVLDAMLVGNAPIAVPKSGGDVFTLSLAHDVEGQIRALGERD